MGEGLERLLRVAGNDSRQGELGETLTYACHLLTPQLGLGRAWCGGEGHSSNRLI
jgi:hypothetical protein